MTPVSPIHSESEARPMAETKKEYSNPYRSLEAIWSVLREHSSRQHPLTVREIYDHLKAMEGAPSRATLSRLLPRELGLMDQLYPGVAAQEGEVSGVNAYVSDGRLHIVLETPEGDTLAQEGLGVEAAAVPFRAPSYFTIDKLLKGGVPFDLHTFPFRLRCVAQVKGKDGRVRLVKYEDWEDSLSPERARKNNVPRRYYLTNALTEAEWRIFSDLIQVYPFLSERQTRKFLTVLNHLRPRKLAQTPSRYAYKRGSDELIKIIAQLDEAIRRRKKVRVTYGEYRLEQAQGRWTPRLLPREKNGELEVEPYALMWSNGNYYLIAKHRGMMNLRVDRILAVEPLAESFQVPADFDPVLYRDRCPVMYPGENTFVRMRCKTAMLNTLVDFFGAVPQYTAPKDGYTEVTMSIAPNGVKLFALQYADGVEVLEPQSLREDILHTLQGAAEKYEK